MYVDITKKSVVTCVEWFHGYGGNALGLKRAIPGLRSIAVCERDAFVVANMVSKMEKGLLDSVPIWTDVTDFPTEPFGYQLLNLFIASYPCQGFSHAGKRLGADDHRHLWPYCRNFIRAVRPGWVWLENVEGHVSLGLSTVLADLEEDSYTAAWGIFSASEVCAPHSRKRVFILAYDKLAFPNGIRCPYGESKEQPTEGGEYAQRDITASGEAGKLVYPNSFRYGTGKHEQDTEDTKRREGSCEPTPGGCVDVWPLHFGGSQHKWEPPRITDGVEPPLGGNADGPADGLDFPRCTGLSDSELEEVYGWMVKGTNRTDELRMCGNGVVPQTAYRAFQVLYAELTRSTGPIAPL